MALCPTCKQESATEHRIEDCQNALLALLRQIRGAEYDLRKILMALPRPERTGGAGVLGQRQKDT